VLVGRENYKRKEFLVFEVFQAEVKSLYPGEGGVQRWYFEERKNHSNWPSEPWKIYTDKGWIGWSELVGIENRLKIEHLPFEDFQAEVRALYPGKGDVKKWYDEEAKKHTNWPADPLRKYANEGWVDWSELVGKENRLKKEYLPFEAFQAEAKSLYPGEGDVQRWYRKEIKKHLNWPSKPREKYMNKGWIGWSELVGKENQLKKEYLPFEDFQAEVRALYPGEGAISTWYYEEIKSHSNWPSNPDKKYVNRGWIGWSELVGKK
jgi:glutaredoxin-related protein